MKTFYLFARLCMILLLMQSPFLFGQAKISYMVDPTYPGLDIEGFYSMDLCSALDPDDTILGILGNFTSFFNTPNEMRRGFVIRAREGGDGLWFNFYNDAIDPSRYTIFWGIEPDGERGYYLAGGSLKDPNVFPVWQGSVQTLTRIDDNGNVVWSQEYMEGNLRDVALHPDDLSVYAVGNDPLGVKIIHVDQNGSLQQGIVFETGIFLDHYKVEKTADGVLVGGNMWVQNTSRPFLIFLEDDLTPVWAHFYQSTNPYEYMTDIAELTDDEFGMLVEGNNDDFDLVRISRLDGSVTQSRNFFRNTLGQSPAFHGNTIAHANLAGTGQTGYLIGGYFGDSQNPNPQNFMMFYDPFNGTYWANDYSNNGPNPTDEEMVAISSEIGNPRFSVSAHYTWYQGFLGIKDRITVSTANKNNGNLNQCSEGFEVVVTPSFFQPTQIQTHYPSNYSGYYEYEAEDAPMLIEACQNGLRSASSLHASFLPEVNIIGPQNKNLLVSYEMSEDYFSANLLLIDMKGANLYSQKLNSTKGTEKISLDHLPAGMYVLQFRAGTYVKNKKILLP